MTESTPDRRGSLDEEHVAAADAFARRVGPHRRKLLGYLIRRTGDPATAEDLLQETLMRAWSAWDSYDARGELRGWLFAIARNALIDHARSESRRQQEIDEFAEPETSAEPDAEQRLLLRDRLQRIDQIVRDLPEEQRRVFDLRLLFGLTFSEIAERMGTSINTALGRMHTVRRKLRERLQAAMPAWGWGAAMAALLLIGLGAAGMQARRLPAAAGDSGFWKTVSGALPFLTDPAYERTELIAFVSRRDGDEDVFLTRNGGEPVNLTPREGLDARPAISPDGKRIAFLSDRGGEPRVWSMSLEGEDLRPLTGNVDPPLGEARDGIMPEWDPVTGELVLTLARQTSPSNQVQELHWLNPATGDTRVFVDGEYQGRLLDARGASFSANGSSVFFMRNLPFQAGTTRLFVVGRHGRDMRLLPPSAPSGHPAPVPGTGGHRVLFTHEGPDANTLWSLDVDTGTVERVSTGELEPGSAVTPSGPGAATTSEILLHARPFGSSRMDLYRLDPRSGAMQRLTHDGALWADWWVGEPRTAGMTTSAGGR